jgi:site-specific recombinase XerD
MNGGKIYDLKKILGHRDIKMTERYAHLSSEYIQQQTAIIGFSASGAKRTKGRIG